MAQYRMPVVMSCCGAVHSRGSGGGTMVALFELYQQEQQH